MAIALSSPNLVLCGFMACGKSTLARILCERAGLPLLDTDEWIEFRERRPVARIFAELGEPYFRSVERLAVAHAASCRGTVISTGGGVPLAPANLWQLCSTGVVFYVAVAAEEIFSRLAGDRSRPLGTGLTSAAAVACKLAQREPFYASIPNRVDATSRSPADVAGEIFKRYSALARIGRVES